MSKEIFVIAGPNGVGKTTSTDNIVPQNIDKINGDLIHFEIFGTHNSNLVTSEAAKKESKKRMNDLLSRSASFAFETNLAKENEWTQIERLQKRGYRIHLIFISVSDLQILNKRINQRVNTGQGHFVDPVIVELRYKEGLRLLSHNFNIADKLTIIDNSTRVTYLLEAEKGRIIFRSGELPAWVNENLADRLIADQGSKNRDVKQMINISDVRARLLELSSENEDIGQTQNKSEGPQR